MKREVIKEKKCALKISLRDTFPQTLFLNQSQVLITEFWEFVCQDVCKHHIWAIYRHALLHYTTSKGDKRISLKLLITACPAEGYLWQSRARLMCTLALQRYLLLLTFKSRIQSLTFIRLLFRFQRVFFWSEFHSCGLSSCLTLFLWKTIVGAILSTRRPPSTQRGMYNPL